MNTLKLKNPITINGKQVAELTYDANEITSEMYATADMKRSRALNSQGDVTAAAFELDYTFHVYIGMAAVIAVNPGYDYSDLERAKGTDVVKFAKVGRDFFIDSAREDSEEGSSENASEITPESTTQASQALRKNS